MASKVVSIEIGYSLTRICEADYKSKAHKVYKSCTMPTPDDVLNDGALTITPEFVESIKSVLAANRIKSKQVVFTITSAKIASREVVIPFVKENRILDVVNANASDYFPVDLSQYQLAYSILGTLGTEKGNQQYKLLVMAAPTALLDGYYNLATALKLEVVALDYAGNSVFQVVKEECAQGVHLIVKIDERASLVMAVQNSVLSFTRNVAYGVDEAMQTVMESLCWGEVSSMEQAMRILQRNDCIAVTVDEEESETAKSAKERAMEDVREALMPLVGGVSRVVDYYASRNQSTPIERVLITGLGADFRGLDELLSKEINYPVKVLKEAKGWNFNRDFKNECFGEYIACLGAAAAPLGFRKEAEKSKGKGAAKAKGGGKINGAAIAFTLLGLGIVVSIALALLSILPYLDAQKRNVQLKAQASSLESIIPIYNEYLETKASYAVVKGMYRQTENRNEELYEFLEELEDKLPRDVNVVSFTSEREGVAINMTVSTKGEAAAAIEQLRTFNSLRGDSVTVTSLVDQGDEEENISAINFTVAAIYQPVGYNPEPEESEETQTQETP